MLIAFLVAAVVGASQPSLVDRYGQECVDKAQAYADSKGYFGRDMETHHILTWLGENCGKEKR